MKAKSPLLDLQFEVATHPELRELVLAVDRSLRARMLPQLVITCTGRTPEENAEVNGVPTSLHLWEPDEVPTKPKRTRAIDFSLRPYSTSGEVEQVRDVFQAEMLKRGRKRFEFLIHDAGSGRHIHAGIKRVTPEEEK